MIKNRINVKRLLPLGPYKEAYCLQDDSVVIETKPPQTDINKPGLLMHGSLKDPLLILKKGLLPHQTEYFKNYKSQPQICLGINSTNTNHKIHTSGSIKNPALAYAENFSKEGTVYILNDDVKQNPTYIEEWETYAGYQRGTAWVRTPLHSSMINGIITKNLPRTMAALLKAGKKIPVYTPDGTEYTLK